MRRSPVQDLFERCAADAQPREPAVNPRHRPGAATGTQVAAPEPDMLPYVLADADTDGVQLVGAYGSVELEYAAIRRRTAILDLPQMAVVPVRGADRRDLLNRLLTQQLQDFQPGEARRSFLVQRSGRIDADLLLIETGEEIIIIVDRHQHARLIEVLEGFVFAEDVEITNTPDRFHIIALHGPAALQTLAAATGDDAVEIAEGGAGVLTIAGAPVTVARVDTTGEVGVLAVMGIDDAADVCAALLAVDGARPVGWHAWNIARVEQGTAVMNIDFGTSHLPHETGVLDSRISFSKGCYPGQEIIARMQSRGGAKQKLIGLDGGGDVLPTSGDQIFLLNADQSIGAAVGVVTSSTLSPMLGAQPIALAMMNKRGLEAQVNLVVHAEGQRAPVTVRAALRAWPAPPTPSTVTPDQDQPR